MSDVYNLANLAQQLRLAEAAEATVSLGYLQALLTFLGTAGLFVTIIFTWRSQRHAQQAIRISERSLEAQRKSSHAQLRGYVSITYARMVKSDQGDAVITIEVKNCGQTPVFVSKIDADAHFLDDDGEIVRSVPRTHYPIAGFSLFPHEQHDILLPTYYALDEAGIFALNLPHAHGGLSLTVTGKVHYVDFTGIVCWTELGVEIGPSLEVPEIRRWLPNQNSSDALA